MMGRILEVYLVVIWVLVPSFFWLRGFWRNDRKDRRVAIVLNGVFVLATGFAGDLCVGINAAGLWLFVAGLLTLALGAFRKVMPREELVWLCLGMVMAGVFMSLVI